MGARAANSTGAAAIVFILVIGFVPVTARLVAFASRAMAARYLRLRSGSPRRPEPVDDGSAFASASQ
jgi:hypothetical protein